MPSPMRRTRCTTSIRTEEDRWLYGPPVMATMEGIRYAERLRHRFCTIGVRTCATQTTA